ncbi:MAG: ABC transporter permease subunit [Peptococcaceae bacterium]|jgi:ABC-2 type transport system permease protein|nr:ABC transporter permease subunit [Peptococcaceae bacterium]
MMAVYKRELRSYFNSMIGYVFIALVVAIIGIYFMANNLVGGYPRFSHTLGSIVFIFLIAIPILTMKSMAEELRFKTDQMLLTYPVSVTKVVLGKFLAMVTVFAVPMLLAALCPLIIAFNGTSYLATDYATILAFFLLGCLFISVGLFVSALTESQIIAAFGTFGLLLLLFLWPQLVSYLPTSAWGTAVALLVIVTCIVFLLYSMTRNKLLSLIVEAAGLVAIVVAYLLAASSFDRLLPRVLSSLSCTKVLDNFAAYNVFDLGGLFFYLSCTALFVYLTVQAVQRRRWN